jgi:peptide deformylase
MLPNGDQVTIKAEGFPAIVFQHETDHLNGTLFIDQVVRYTKPPQTVL